MRQIIAIAAIAIAAGIAAPAQARNTLVVGQASPMPQDLHSMQGRSSIAMQRAQRLAYQQTKARPITGLPQSRAAR